MPHCTIRNSFLPRMSLNGMKRLGQSTTASKPYHTRSFAPFSSRPGNAAGLSTRSLRLQRLRASDAAAGDLSESGDQQQQPERPVAPYDLKPFPRRRERNPYRLLGVDQEASFDEIQDARNYLYELYKWDEPSREAIEAAFDTLLQTHYKQRRKLGFQPSGVHGRSAPRAVQAPTVVDRVKALFDPTVTMRTIINEGAVFGAFALWVLFSSDQSIPLAGTVAYCIYQFQQKRIKRDPEGPYFGGNPMLGAVLSTMMCLAVACGVMTVATKPLAAIIGQTARQVGAFITIVVMGALGMYLK